MKLSIQDIYQAARAAGFSPDQATTWTAIAMAESGGETGALNDVGEHSVGLWQINVGVHGNRWGNLNDPYANARAAYEISNQGTDMRPWTVTHDSRAGTAADYRTYLPQVSAITGYTGDPRGVAGYGAALPPPLPPSGPEDMIGTPMSMTATYEGMPDPTYDQIDPGLDASAGVDSDDDGLTDAFERLAGTNPELADTDADGLSDAYEVAVAGTDPLLADTDRDALSDADEIALGTDATVWDTDADGASDGVEVKYGADPLVAENGTVPEPPLTAPTTATTVPMTTQQPPTTPTGSSAADAFVQLAQAQKGDAYVFGAETSLDDPDPDAWDCSELVQWAAHQVGVTVPDGAMYQYLELKNEGQLMSVEQALQTKGALLFYFSDEPTPGGSRPGQAHVAISLGDGRTIEARGSSYGVNEFPAAGRFNYAGVVPELSGPLQGSPPMPALMTLGASGYDQIDAGLPAGGVIDSDADGLSDAFEQMAGLDPLMVDSDNDGLDDAMEVLGGTVEESPGPQPLTREEVRAALAAQGLDGAGDEDEDGLSNRYEIRHGLDAFSADSDQDGLDDATELALGTDPTAIDTDADGLTDRAEIEFGSDPLTRGTPGDRWGLAGADVEADIDPGDLADVGLDLD